MQNPLLGGGDLSTIIERVPTGGSETDGYSKYHNRGGVSTLTLEATLDKKGKHKNGFIQPVQHAAIFP